MQRRCCLNRAFQTVRQHRGPAAAAIRPRYRIVADPGGPDSSLDRAGPQRLAPSARLRTGLENLLAVWRWLREVVAAIPALFQHSPERRLEYPRRRRDLCSNRGRWGLPKHGSAEHRPECRCPLAIELPQRHRLRRDRVSIGRTDYSPPEAPGQADFAPPGQAPAPVHGLRVRLSQPRAGSCRK